MVRERSVKAPMKVTAFWQNPENLVIFFKTSPFRDRVAKLRGPSEGLGGNAANV